MVSMQKEPVAIGAALTSFATALIALLVGFEIVDWTPEQIGLVLGVVSVPPCSSGRWSGRGLRLLSPCGVLHPDLAIERQ